MDRLDAMRVFVTTIDEGSLAAAGRRLGKSPAAVSRAIAGLEAHAGIQLLHRTTRALRLSDTGALYAETCRRVLAELDEADRIAAGEGSAPRGTLSVTAPVVSGEEVLRPVVDAFLDTYPSVSLRLLLLDRPVNLIEEGIDVALRIAQLPDSSLVALRVGEVRRLVVGAPAYLDTAPAITAPADLAAHRIISMSHFGQESWSFPPSGRHAARVVSFAPRLVVNSVRASVASAVEGHGLARVMSYQVAEQLRTGQLRCVLAEADPEPLPVQIVTPAGRLAMPKVRAFADFAAPRLRARFAALAMPETDGA
ncbi:LysR family transcriptional regulator [Oceanicella sp. SM1341]|uniref:LysR family transcriptional regulator n=1 Tax=Oceanicella sp. SM1341 TaxID=1548889 RepID=UPI000E490F0F|nr:LysR family transcriptional regulator [Oceanicella sp. SM1341]